MSAISNGRGWFNLGLDNMDAGSEVSMKFWEAHKRWFNEGVALITNLVVNGDGDGLLLFDSGLLSMAQHIRDRLAASGVEVRALPPSIGDELSKKLQ
jgi:glyoxylase-like metal-dependent hydrolase (beta-lactamase superfamily II)